MLIKGKETMGKELSKIGIPIPFDMLTSYGAWREVRKYTDWRRGLEPPTD
jgi:hypothetical protein